VLIDHPVVVDLSLQLPGPYASMLLRELGARVVKVEPPTGDPVAEWDPWMYRVLNKMKDCIRLDLKKPAGIEVAKRLIAKADVVLEGFRPGVTERLGLGYASLAGRFPRLVYCSISGYGQSGPYRSVPGHEINYFAMGGGLQLERQRLRVDDPAAESDIPMVDLATGTTAALAIVDALRDRDVTGNGAYLDIAMLDQAVFWANLKGNRREGRHSPRDEPAYGVFRTKDGTFLSLGVIEDKFWRMLCIAMGFDDWSADVGLSTHDGRLRQRVIIRKRLSKALCLEPREVLLARLHAHGVPAAPAHFSEEIASDPQIFERRMFSFDRGEADLRAPVQMMEPDLETSGSGESSKQVAQRDAATILTELGFSDVERAQLTMSRVVFPPPASG
jgi:crotonobetainyl-CoA:carnitine CoA-transferase CaiB-like acyl-CoA transferase